MMQKTRRWRLPAFIAAAVLAVAMLGIRPASVALAQDDAATNVLPNATDVSVQWTMAQAEKPEITVGDPLALTLTVNHPAGTQALLPQLDATWGDFELSSQSPVAVTENADGSLTTAQTLEVTLFAPGLYATPPLAITLSDGDGNLSQALAGPVDVTVASVLNDGQSELYDIKGQAALPLPANYLPIVGAIALLLGAGALGWLLYRRFSRSTGVGTPLQHALTELTQIEQLDYPSLGNFKLHYMLTTETLRRYVEAVYHVPALDMTTDELKQALTRTPIGAQHADEMIGLLADADLVKFAKLTPSEDAAHELTAEVRTLINALAAEAAEQAASVEASAEAAAKQTPAAIHPATNGA